MEQYFLDTTADNKQIGSVLTTFMWKGAEVARSGVKVRWRDMSKHVEAGGLGLKRILLWNKAMLIKHLGHCFEKRLFVDSLGTFCKAQKSILLSCTYSTG